MVWNVSEAGHKQHYGRCLTGSNTGIKDIDQQIAEVTAKIDHVEEEISSVNQKINQLEWYHSSNNGRTETNFTHRETAIMHRKTAIAHRKTAIAHKRRAIVQNKGNSTKYVRLNHLSKGEVPVVFWSALKQNSSNSNISKLRSITTYSIWKNVRWIS